MGTTAFQKGLGAIHALSHPVGALYNTHHGLTNAVFTPYVLAFNRDAVGDKIGRLAAWLGIAGGFDGFLDYVRSLCRELGVPPTLAGIGVDDARFAEMAAMAVVDPTAGGNPRALTEADALDLYGQARDGRLEAAP
jgi:alcohol dehydrogenase